MQKENVTETLNYFGTVSVWISSIFLGIVTIKIGDRIIKYVLNALDASRLNTLKKNTIGIVEDLLKPITETIAKIEINFDKFQKEHHGVIAKNEGVLLEVTNSNKELVKLIKEYSDKLEEKK